jgi:hypothetical protein
MPKKSALWALFLLLLLSIYEALKLSQSTPYQIAAGSVTLQKSNERIPYLEANLFFSLRVCGLTLNGSSLTGVISLMTLFSLSNSLPITCNFFGFGVKSLPSPFLALPLHNRSEKKKRLVISLSVEHVTIF